MDNDIQTGAHCVSANHFVPIGRTASSGRGQGVFTASFNAALHNNNGSHLAVEAVVTSINKVSGLSAASVVMQAQTYNGVWRTVADGYTYCLRCSSLSLAPFPMTAQRVKVDVIMPEWSPTGQLFLASYSY